MEPYNEHRPVPTTQRYLSQMAERDNAPKEFQDEANPAHPEPSEQKGISSRDDLKRELMDRMASAKEKPLDKVNRQRGEHVVKDPVTGNLVTTRDADLNGEQPCNMHAHRSLMFSDLREGLSASHPGNLTHYPYLPSRPVSLTSVLRSFDQLQVGLTFGFVMIWFFLAFPNGRWWLPFSWPWVVWIFRTLIIGAIAFASVITLGFLKRGLEREIDHVRMDMYQERGQKFTPPIPESVEWMNMFIRTIWGLINPELFVSIADMIEGTCN